VQQRFDELRKLVNELRPSILDDVGLGRAVRSHMDTFLRPARLQVGLHVTEMKERLPAEIETIAFRIIREASTNMLGTSLPSLHVGKYLGTANEFRQASMLSRDHPGSR
jgi:signal transduction histidine kinase